MRILLLLSFCLFFWASSAAQNAIVTTEVNTVTTVDTYIEGILVSSEVSLGEQTLESEITKQEFVDDLFPTLKAKYNLTIDEAGYECLNVEVITDEIYGGTFRVADSDPFGESAKLILLERPAGQPFIGNTVFSWELISIGLDASVDENEYDFKIVAIKK